MLISVIMQSFLGHYAGAAENREADFIRAVRSVVAQSYREWELLIIADGCSKTVDIYNKHFKSNTNIKCIYIEKQPLWSGVPRQTGLDAAEGDVVIYIDTDDLWGKEHLEVLINCITPDCDWWYWNAFFVLNGHLSKDKWRLLPQETSLEKWHINTGTIAHRKNVNAKWTANDYIGKHEDWNFAEQLISAHPNRKFIGGMQYYIMHHQEIKLIPA